MTDAQLIPFGWSTDQGKLVDVVEVPRGRACRCVCPACHTPLIARKGDVRQAHFAHAARNVYADTDDVCDFSLFVAARLMLKQIIGRHLAMDLPAYRDCVVDERDDDIVEWFTATEARRVEVTDVEVEEPFENVLVDVQGRVGAHRFVVYVSYPGRPIPDDLRNPRDAACGILELRLDAVGTAFAEKQASKSYREALMDVLVAPGKAKRWIYHPRYARERDIAEKRLRVRATRVGSSERGLHQSAKAPTPRMVRFECVLCAETWDADEHAGITDCRSCPGRLCARPMRPR